MDSSRQNEESVEFDDDTVFTWPTLVVKEFLAAIFVMVGLLFYSFFVNAPLGELADPSQAENPAKAPWYFAGLQEQLVYFDPWFAGVVLPSIIVVGLILIPYLTLRGTVILLLRSGNLPYLSLLRDTCSGISWYTLALY
jgi:quinol-cytochrome oxidoreductase complex cytochrome b subunit